jgi:dCTP deaminase
MHFMIINGQTLLQYKPILGMLTKKHTYLGYSHGLSECGYDIRIAASHWLFPGRSFRLAHAIEEFDMPIHIMGRVLNKSSWARQGLDASMTTNVEPGWRGYLTLELRYSGWKPLLVPAGVGIAQVIFEPLLEPTQYVGKYQDQPQGPVPARF